jgi:hypothetical protein
MLSGIVVHTQVGELQFERCERRRQGHVPVVVAVVVDVLERVVAEAGGNRETIVDGVPARQLERPGLAFFVAGRGGDRLDIGRVASREEHLVAEPDGAGGLGAVVALAPRIVRVGVLRQAEVGGEVLRHAPVPARPDVDFEIRARPGIRIAGRGECTDVELLREFHVDRALGRGFAARQRQAAKHEVGGAAEAAGDDGRGLGVCGRNGSQRDQQERFAAGIHDQGFSQGNPVPGRSLPPRVVTAIRSKRPLV